MNRERAERDLATIRRLMEESRNQISGTGRHWVVWGVASVLGLLGTWAAVAGRVGVRPLWIWSGLLAGAWFASLWMGRRGSGGGVRNEITRLVHAIWIGLGISFTILGVGGMLSPLVDSRALPGLFAAAMGAGIFATGAVAGLAWLRWVAVVWWGGGVLLLALPGAHTLPLMAGMLVVLQILPGVILERRAEAFRRNPAEDPA